MHTPTDLRSHLKRARGHGPAHEGTHHFWLQRVTALALVPLSCWFMVKFVTLLIGADRMAVAQWLKSPFVALALVALWLALLVHARLGIQVIIEDYVHCKGKKIAMLLLNNATMLVLGALALFAIARLHFIGI